VAHAHGRPLGWLAAAEARLDLRLLGGHGSALLPVHAGPQLQVEIRLLERLPSHPPERLGELLPDMWAGAQRGAVEAISMEIIDQMAAPAAGFP
jgi:hypothetical protein